MNTLPQPKAFKTFNEWIAKHQIILPSALPAHINHSTISFDWNSAVYNGPFVGRDNIPFIEQ